MLKKVLVANRGEIACRVFRTLRRLGIGSVAVYHHEDRKSPHVAMADEAVLLEGETPSAAYLDQGRILEICRETGCDGIHPGYGFLSESATFCERAIETGITFIGPDAESMRLMGDKIRSREFAAAQGLPVAPSVSYAGDLDALIRDATAIGFPLLIKASAGGGGKGMRIVHSASELAENIRLAAGEAERYFGDGRVYAERLVPRPRHIEVQVLGDGHGGAVHLFERECSLQRRYQKIVEEAPAPNLAPQLRAEICAAAVRLASAARYKNAGTIEFILGDDGVFYFLEMNTRLQVEHPVTEWILGLDLVEEQLKIASGEGLSFSQDALTPRGHAIECRVNAEQPAKDFQPATGRIGVLQIPAGPNLRFDGGIVQGQTITPSFDSLLGKMIAFGETREAAAEHLADALDNLVVLGVANNIDYLARIMRNAEFRAGRLHTGFLTQEAGDLAGPAPDEGERAAALLAAAMADPDFRRIAFDVPEPYASIGRWRN